MSKLKQLPVYREKKIGDDAGVYVASCLFVREEARGTGVARMLLGNAAKFVRAWGGTSLEAYPRFVDARVADEQMFMGNGQMMMDLGFKEIAGERPYSILRLDV